MVFSHLYFTLHGHLHKPVCAVGSTRRAGAVLAIRGRGIVPYPTADRRARTIAPLYSQAPLIDQHRGSGLTTTRVRRSFSTTLVRSRLPIYISYFVLESGVLSRLLCCPRTLVGLLHGALSGRLYTLCFTRGGDGKGALTVALIVDASARCPSTVYYYSR